MFGPRGSGWLAVWPPTVPCRPLLVFPSAGPPQVRSRIIRKRINVRVEHIRQSKCRQDFLDRVKRNEDIKRQAKESGSTCLRWRCCPRPDPPPPPAAAAAAAAAATCARWEFGGSMGVFPVRSAFSRHHASAFAGSRPRPPCGLPLRPACAFVFVLAPSLCAGAEKVAQNQIKREPILPKAGYIVKAGSATGLPIVMRPKPFDAFI